MKRAMISELRNRLSAYLRLVRRGQSVVVYDRDRPIARIEPVGAPAAPSGADWVDDLVRAGSLRPPVADLPEGWLDQRPDTRADIVRALLDERESGR